MLKILNLFSYILIICSACEMIVSVMTIRNIIKYTLYEKIRSIIFGLNFCSVVVIAIYMIFCFFTALFSQVLLREIAAYALALQIVLHESIFFYIEVPKERYKYFVKALWCCAVCIGVNMLILIIY